MYINEASLESIHLGKNRIVPILHTLLHTIHKEKETALHQHYFTLILNFVILVSILRILFPLRHFYINPEYFF